MYSPVYDFSNDEYYAALMASFASFGGGWGDPEPEAQPEPQSAAPAQAPASAQAASAPPAQAQAASSESAYSPNYDDPNSLLALMDSAGGSGGNTSMGNTVQLPPEFRNPENEARTADEMRGFGITPPEPGTIDSSATQQLGQRLYDKEDWHDSPMLPALVMMGGAWAGGALANGGAGAAAAGAGAGAGAGYGGAATTYPLAAAGGPITVTPIAGAGFGAGAAAAAPAVAAGAGGSGAVAAPAAAAAGPAASAASQDMAQVIQGASGGGSVVSRATRGLGNFIHNNQDVVGSIIGGIGEGMAADRAAQNDRDLLRERHDLTAGNYSGTDPGRGFRGFAGGNSGVSPVERFDRYSGWSYQYDQKTGRFIKVADEPLRAGG